MKKDSSTSKGTLHQHVLRFCRHIAGSAQIVAISLLDNHYSEMSSVRATLEVLMVVRDFQPRLMSYVKIIDGRSIVLFAADLWVFERDVDRGFLGEALAGTLIFPHTILFGEDFMYKQEILLKKRLILELLENLVLNFPDLANQLHIEPKYFMYETMLNRVRIFPPLVYGKSNLINGATPKKEIEIVLHSYLEALKQLKKEKKIAFSDNYIMVPKKLVTKSKKPKVRLANLSRNAPRTLFTSVLLSFPQFLNFFSQNTESLLKLNKFIMKRKEGLTRSFVDPKKYVFVPTAEGLVSLADRLDIESFARKILLRGEKAKIVIEPVGGVLNDVYLIKAYPNDMEKKVLVKRFKDWSGFKWFPLTLWSFGARNLAVLGRTRLEKEYAIGEFLRCNGIRVPKILHISHSKRLLFMEFIEGEDLSRVIKRIAKVKDKETEKDLAKIEKVGEIYAQVHALKVTLGDTKPENVILDYEDNIYLLDFEQASREGDFAWDIAVFLYYAGHYLQPLYSDGKAKSIAKAFVSGYLKGGGDVAIIQKAGSSKFTRIFSVFTMPSIMFAMSNVCKKTAKR